MKLTEKLIISMCYDIAVDCASEEELKKWSSENTTFQQILDDHEKINRFNQIFTNHKKDGTPINKPELTGVNQEVIDQIQNIITNILAYIEDGKVPNGYSSIKKILEDKA